MHSNSSTLCPTPGKTGCNVYNKTNGHGSSTQRIVLSRVKQGKRERWDIKKHLLGISQTQVSWWVLGVWDEESPGHDSLHRCVLLSLCYSTIHRRTRNMQKISHRNSWVGCQHDGSECCRSSVHAHKRISAFRCRKVWERHADECACTGD